MDLKYNKSKEEIMIHITINHREFTDKQKKK